MVPFVLKRRHCLVSSCPAGGSVTDSPSLPSRRILETTINDYRPFFAAVYFPPPVSVEVSIFTPSLPSPLAKLPF